MKAYDNYVEKRFVFYSACEMAYTNVQKSAHRTIVSKLIFYQFFSSNKNNTNTLLKRFRRRLLY